MAFLHNSHSWLVGLFSNGSLPVLESTGSGVQGGRPAYSPDAFDDVPKKGKLAQRLLGSSKNVTGKLVFGSHVAGRTHHRWAEPSDAGGFEGAAMRSEEVQQASQS